MPSRRCAARWTTPNKDVHTAAIRVLCEWKTGDAAPVLLELAKTSSRAG